MVYTCDGLIFAIVYMCVAGRGLIFDICVKKGGGKGRVIYMT